MCGAGWRNSIYDLTNVKVDQYEHTSILGETYEGCWIDKKNRDLPIGIKEGYGNYEKCFNLARHKFGMKYASL